MIVECGNSWSQVVAATTEELEWLAKRCSTEYRAWGDVDGDGIYSMLAGKMFPSGLAVGMRRDAAKDGIRVEVTDRRPEMVPPLAPDNVDKACHWLRPYQLDAVRAALRHTRGVVKAPTGAGKCLGLGTPVILSSGKVLPVQDVRPGDSLLGPDSRPRKVLSVSRGVGPLFRLVPTRGEPWVCNDVHVLSLVNAETGDVIDIPLNEYLSKPKAWQRKHKLFMPESVSFQNGINTAELPVSPYALGHGLVGAVHFPCPGRTEDLGIQDEYMLGPVSVRVELLAGLIDRIGIKPNGKCSAHAPHKPLVDAVAWIARTLGLRADKSKNRLCGIGTIWKVTISGDFSRLPLRKSHPVTNADRLVDPRLSGFVAQPIGSGEFFGFTLDGDGRFLLGDCTVTHNTEILAGVAQSVPIHWLFLVHRKTLVNQTADRYTQRTGLRAGRFESGRWTRGDGGLTCATFAGIHSAMKSDSREARALIAETKGLLVDECHTASAETHTDVIQAMTQAGYRIGFSGTPFDRDTKGNLRLIGAIGPMAYEITSQELMQQGAIAHATVHMVPCYVGENISPYADWQAVYRVGILRSKPRNRLLHSLAIQAPKPCMVFVDDLLVGKNLARDLSESCRAKFVCGYTTDAERDKYLKDLAGGALDVIVCTEVFQEGVDVPALASFIQGAGKKSPIDVLQRLGRTLRGKTSVHVWDIWDLGHSWLENHAKQRKAVYEREGHTVVVEY